MDAINTTIKTRPVRKNPPSIFAFSNAILKFSKYKKLFGKSKTEEVLYSSVVLNAVKIHTQTGMSATKEAAIKNTYKSRDATFIIVDARFFK